VTSIRDAVIDDVRVLVAFDPVVLRGDNTRATWIRDHVRAGVVRVAELDSEVVGYCAVQESFFEHGFVELLIVAERARRNGVGTDLLCDALKRCRTTKVWTSTNFSNVPMQQLLLKLGWQSAGIIYGLDEGDPELIFMARRPDSASTGFRSTELKPGLSQ
jgi:GNAT superfamily N-acetyltransferase